MKIENCAKIGKYSKHEIKEKETIAWFAGDMSIRADYIKRNLIKGEIIEADSLGEFAQGSLERSLELLKLNGLQIGKNNEEFGYFIYPPSQKINQFKRLFVYKRN